MSELLEKLSSPDLRDGVGGALVLLALLYFILRTPGKGCPSLLLLGAGLLSLFASFAIGYLGLKFRHPSAGFLSPSHPLHGPVQAALRYYVGIPLLLVGALLETTRTRRRLRDSADTIHEQERRVRDLARAVDEVVTLEDNLEETNRDLQSTREELNRQSAEASRVSTKLRETLNLLMGSEEKFRSIFERANDGLVVVDLETRKIAQANPRMAELTGHDVSELAGMRLRDVYGEELDRGDLARIRELARKGSLPPIEIIRRDGTPFRAEVSISIIDVGGRPVLVASTRDVTERVRLLEEVEDKNRALEDRSHNLRDANRKLALRAEKMRAMNEKLRELQEVKDSFLSSVSHELRTPLTSIRSFSEILLQYKDADDEVKSEFISIINKESERLTRLINDVLDLAKIEAGEMTFAMVVVDLRGLVQDVSQSLTPLATKRNLTIESAIPDNLPAVSGDRDKLHQVLTNLISNALKFGREGASVRVSAGRADEGMVEVSVQDRGPGIPKEELQRIFDKFRQVGDTLTEKPDGTGLGLAICREIITLHGGRIWVRSTVGEGSTFYFTVRAYSSEAEADEPSPPRDASEAALPAPEPDRAPFAAPPTTVAAEPPRELAATLADVKLPPLRRAKRPREDGEEGLRPLLERKVRPPALRYVRRDGDEPRT